MKKKFPRKILLLSIVPPSSNYSGGLVLEQLCRFLPPGSLVCFALMDPQFRPQIADDLKWIPIEYAPKPADGWPKMPYRMTKLLSLVGESYHAVVTNRSLIKRIVRFGKKHRVNTLWVTLQGQTTIRLAKPIADALNIPLLTEVWDPPEWWLKENNIDSISYKLIMKQFAKTLKASKACAVAGPAMAKEYKELFKVNTVDFLPSLKACWACPPGRKIHSPHEIIIGVVGQLYSSQEWDCLLAALDRHNWRIGRRQVKIRLLGSYFTISSFSKKHIEYLGYQDQKNTIKLMNECDILYCPYFFNPELAKVSRLSFPSKLATYLAAGRPVFFHGPAYASPGIFLREKEAGMICNSLVPQQIIKRLHELEANSDLYAKFAQNGRKLFDQYFTFEILHRHFAKFLDIDEKELVEI